MRAIALLLLLTVAATAQTTSQDPQGRIDYSGKEYVAPAAAGQAHFCGFDQYPPSAIRSGAQGETTLNFIIQADGTTAGGEVVTSSGNAALDDAAITCIKSWRYIPATHNGVPISTRWSAKVIWRLPYANLDPNLTALYLTGLQCARLLPSKDDLLNVTGPTILGIHVWHGEVGSLIVISSSGNANLDARTKSCFENKAADYAARIAGDKATRYQIDWKSHYEVNWK